ncbi:MAG: hypothetical protein JWM27_1832 [Gemmatimonadetes bacterium]|nr:hypothetical protein [Gemmatimonadota bacterium]
MDTKPGASPIAASAADVDAWRELFAEARRRVPADAGCEAEWAGFRAHVRGMLGRLMGCRGEMEPRAWTARRIALARIEFEGFAGDPALARAALDRDEPTFGGA